MGEKEDKEKAEKLAAAKKRVAQLQKKKKAAAAGEKSGSKKSTKDDAPKSPTKDEPEADERAPDEAQNQTIESTALLNEVEEDDVDPDEAAFNDAINAAGKGTVEETANPDLVEDVMRSEPDSIANGKTRGPHARQPSLSLQSKLRSSSFRSGPLSPSATAGLPPLTPDGDTLPEIYRKQSVRLDELEKENKRLAKDVADVEGRWRKGEEELEELRERSVEIAALKSQAQKSVEAEAETVKLRAEVSALTREKAQRKTAAGDRRASGQTESSDTEAVRLRSELNGKDSTIADMELEISRLRSQLNTQTQGCDKHGEQISALQSSLTTTETKIRGLRNELADAKKALARATEKAVVEGTEKTSKDTKIRNLEREMASAVAAREEVVRKAEGLEKKVEAMNKLHREAEARNASKLSTAEAGSREAGVLKARLASTENENQRLREERERRKKKSLDRTGEGEDGLDELEDEERNKLKRRIRDLEGEVFDLRRGAWRDKRRDLQDEGEASPAKSHDDTDFDEVDLSGPGSRRRSLANTLSSQQQQQKHSGFSQVLNSGLAAFRAATTSPDSHQTQQTRPRNDSLLEEFDDDAFDENAFAEAQREEEMRKMVEHVREVKRKLKEWEGWRLDMVDLRKGGAGEQGFGEIFEV